MAVVVLPKDDVDCSHLNSQYCNNRWSRCRRFESESGAVAVVGGVKGVSGDGGEGEGDYRFHPLSCQLDLTPWWKK